jgi:hypothetical protein
MVLASPAPAGGRMGAPSPGAAGLGDRLNPGIGNGGYDVLRYDLVLRYATSDPAQAIDGDETILARATQSLSRFNLDFAKANTASMVSVFPVPVGITTVTGSSTSVVRAARTA